MRKVRLPPSLQVFLGCAGADEARHRWFFGRARQAEADLLQRLLGRDRDTAFGKVHDFARLRTVADWQAAVPIRTYEAVEPWIERAAHGEPDVLTSEPVIFFRKSSGTTGASKKLPVTASSETADLRLFRLTYALPFRLFPGLADRDDHVLNLMFNGQVDPPPRLPSGVPWGSMADELSQLIASPLAMLHGIPGSRAPWFDPGRLLPAADLTYFRLRLALEAPIRGLVATNPSTLVTLARRLNEDFERLIQEIRDGTVLGERRAGCGPAPARARELEDRRRASGRLRLVDVWPWLDYALTWKSGTCSLYLPQLQEEIGPDAVLLPFCYGASEGLGTAQLDDHPRGGFLAPADVLFEFAPAENDLTADTPTLLGHQLAGAGPGEYHLVHTAQNGLHRYSVGDVVEVIEVVDGVPRVEFKRRAGTISSFTGEKITEAHVIQAVTRACEYFHLTLANFTCCPQWGDPPRYEFVLELDRASGSVGVEPFARELDRLLAEVNAEYPAKRESGRLDGPRVHLVPPGTFDRLREARADQKRASLAQIKERPLQKDGSLLEQLAGAEK